MSNEPVRISALVTGLLVAVASALFLLDAGASMYAAAGVALAEFAGVFGGGEVARSRAWGPKTVDAVMDAEAVVAAGERGEHG